MSSINSAALESIEDGIDQLARAHPYANADYLHERTRNGLHYVTKQLEGRVTLRQHRELLVDAGWLFLLNACVQYDRGQREAANLSKAAALRIGEEAGHGEIKAWAWEIEAWFALTQSRWQDMLNAVEAGHMADQTHSVGVQLYAHKARAAARMGDARLVRDSLDAGRARLDRLPRPDHPEHHFIIDPDKWDFYEMDAYRLLGDDERAAAHARSVIRISTGPDGTEISPMRAAEARLTLGVAAARMGEIEEAIGMGTTALEADRKSLPSLLLVADELDKELRARYPARFRHATFSLIILQFMQCYGYRNQTFHFIVRDEFISGHVRGQSCDRIRFTFFTRQEERLGDVDQKVNLPAHIRYVTDRFKGLPSDFRSL